MFFFFWGGRGEDGFVLIFSVGIVRFVCWLTEFSCCCCSTGRVRALGFGGRLGFLTWGHLGFLGLK